MNESRLNESTTTVQNSESLNPVFVKRVSVLLILVAMTLVTARLCDAPTLASANDRSRWCTVWSLVEKNTYSIDEIRKVKGWDSIDIVRHDGHFYSSKPALLPRLVAELYRGWKLVTGYDLLKQTDLTIRSLLFLINVIPMTIALFFWSKLIQREVHSPTAQIWLIAASCFATLVTPFLTVFNNHTVAISCFLIALPLAIDCYGDQKKSNWKFALCGFLLAFGICNELPAALFGLGVFGLLVSQDWKRTALLFVPFALVPLMAFFITNYHATGTWKPFYSSYGTETYEFTHEGVPSYWSDPKGIDKPRDTPWQYLFHCTIGHHGILSLSPIFLLTLCGWSFRRTWSQPRLQFFQLLGVLLTLITLGFFLSRTQNYNYSGVSVALRWMLWLIPFWILAMFSLFDAFFQKRWFRVLSTPLLLVSIFSAWFPQNAPWTQPWLYRVMQSAGWIHYTDPTPKFARQHLTWIAQLPHGELDPQYFIRLETVGADESISSIELRDAGPHGTGERLLQVTRTTTRAGESPQSDSVTYSIDQQQFESGAKVEDFLKSRTDGIEINAADLRFFQGIPRPVQYVLTRIRYPKTSLRTDALRTGEIFTNTRNADESLRLWRNVVISEELPFGVLSWEDRVIDSKNGGTISTQRWRVVETGKVLERQAEFPF